LHCSSTAFATELGEHGCYRAHVRATFQNARQPISVLAVAAFVALAALAGWHSFRGSWNEVGSERLAYQSLTPLDREHAAVQALADPRALDFWKDHLRRGDRFYLNVAPTHTNIAAGWPAVLALVAGYYLVPAIGVAQADHATVVLSWDEPPRRAGVPLRSTTRLPGLDVSFSRVAP
jgi:hypothetical protein